MAPSAPNLEHLPLTALRPNPRNARTHSRKQVNQIARSIERFGFTNPILVDENLGVLAGHGRLEAARQLQLPTVPVLRFAHMSAADKRAYVLADNKLALNAGWDVELLSLELDGLLELGFEVELTGFEPAEVDLILSDAADADPMRGSSPEDATPEASASAVSRLGDLWTLGRHRLVCGDARDPGAYRALLGSEMADVIFTDPPYNVKIAGHVRTDASHREFAMASGEMDQASFVAFLKQTLGPAAAAARNGAIAFVCMDWRHMGEMLEAGQAVFGDLKNLCVWTKSNGGMGSLYRSQHELVFVFKNGDGEHCNMVQLGANGRNRTNVWTYAGVNAFGAKRDEELSMHPTVKPVLLIEDALKDVSARNAIVLDPFGGSGSTLIAAQRCGRQARLIEFDPLYCDVIVRRFQAYTGKQARCAKSGQNFDDVEHARTGPRP